jgi:hypothetical protein
MAQNFFNAATKMETVFGPDGAELITTRLNAIDLVRHAGFSWSNRAATAAVPEAPVTAAVTDTPALLDPTDPAETVAPVNAAAEAVVLGDTPPTIDHATTPLAEIALLITGTDDVQKYLSGFTVDALRTMAEERYGQRLHHKVSVDTAVDKIIAFEAEKTSKESN